MTQTHPPVTAPLVSLLVRAAVAGPIAQYLQTQADKIARRVPEIQVHIVTGDPIDGGWCYRHREPILDQRDHCHRVQSGKTPCLVRPTQLVWLNANATGLPLVDGDARIVGVLVTDTTGVTTGTSFEDGLDATDHLQLAGTCSHCQTHRDRRYTLLVRDGDQGILRSLGASCARELTGGAVRDGLLKLLVGLQESLPQVVLPSHVRDGAVAPLLEVIALTIRVNEIQGGFVRSMAGTRSRPSTRDAVFAALSWEPTQVGPRPLLTTADLTDTDLQQAQSAIDAMAEWTDTGDFATNLKRIAASEHIEISGRRQRLGMAVCIPDAANREKLRRARAAERTRQDPEGAPATEPGIYETEAGRVYRVQVGDSGFPYAKVLTKLVGEAKRLTEAGQTVKADYVYERGAIRQVRAHHRVSVQRAEELSILFAQCIVCGTHLKAAESVQRGIGPICYKRIGGE